MGPMYWIFFAPVKSDRDRLKMKLEDFRSAIDAKMRQLDAD